MGKSKARFLLRVRVSAAEYLTDALLVEVADAGGVGPKSASGISIASATSL